MSPFEKLDAWARSHQLVLAVYSATAEWPSEEKYGLTSQCRRAAVSAVANIAEGSAKRGPGEFRRYLDITLGSLAELEYYLRLAKDLGLLSSGEYDALRAIHQPAARTTWRLYCTIRDHRK